jgi:trimeric autotransporter adhesin
MRRDAFWWLCGLLVLAGVADSAAQTFTGGIRGAVRDPGGVIPGVVVTLTNEGTNLSRTTTSNELGEYVFAAVSPGTYSVRAILQGFRAFERRGINVATQQFITLDIMLEVGAVAESITVTADAPLIETSTASTGEVLDRLALETLPAPGRSAFVMAVTVPTVTTSGDPQWNRMQDQTNVSYVSLGGGGRRSNDYLVDGVSITDMVNRPALLPTIEALDDVKVQVHTFDAEMGRVGGGVFNATGRSGTNTFRGSAFYQNRPEWGAANNWFNSRDGIPKPSGLYFHTYGGGVGGPILRNRTFFWTATEGYRTITTRNGNLVFPTDRERNGDFSQTFDRNGQLVVIYDPMTTRPDGQGGFIRDPFPGNVIPADRINTVARNVNRYLPRPDETRSGADGIANYRRTAQIQDLVDMVTLKIEHKFTNQLSMTGMYLWNRSNEPFGVYFDEHRELDPAAQVLYRRPRVLALNGTYVMSPTTVMTLRYGYMSFPDGNTPASLGFDVGSLGFNPSFVSSIRQNKFPAFQIREMGELASTGSIIGDGGDTRSRFYSSVVNATVSRFFGRHTVKIGGDVRHRGRDSFGVGQTAGVFSFDREWTQANPFGGARTDQGLPYASFLLGLPSANPAITSTLPIQEPVDSYVRYYAGYIQDDLRIGANLAINLGLRYEYETGLTEVEKRMVVAFDRDAVSPLAARTGLDLRGGIRYAGEDGVPDYQGLARKDKLSPRVGMAWSVDPKTVFRGGYGLFWAPLQYGTGRSIGFSETTFVEHADRLIPSVTLDNPFPRGLRQPAGNSGGLLTGVSQQVSFVSPDAEAGYVHQFAADLQREITSTMAVTLGYTGSRGEDLDYGVININQLHPDVVAQWGSRLQDRVSNPFFGIPEAAAFATSSTISRAQLLRPFPHFGNLLEDGRGGARSRYHAVTVKLDRRMAGGFGGRFHYTWSRLDTDQFQETSIYTTGRQSRPLNAYDLAAEYSRSLLDVPHRVVLSPIVQLPFGEGRRWATSGLAERLLGGWTMSLVALYESGSPHNIVQSSDNTGSFGGVQRPNWTGTDPKTPGDVYERLNNYINPAAYQAAPAFTFGTGPRTDPRIRTPFRQNYDVALVKDTRIVRSVRGQIRLEVLNLTNTPKFRDGGESRFGLGAFGTITRQGGFSRLTQIMFRTRW